MEVVGRGLRACACAGVDQGCPVVFTVSSRHVAHEDFDPVVPLIVALSTENVPGVGATWTAFGLDDQEGVAIFIVFVSVLPFWRALLTTYLCAGDLDRA